MSLPKYRVDTAPIASTVGASVHIEDTIELSSVNVGGRELGFDGPIEFDVTVSNVETGLIAQGTAYATIVAPCDRCLDEARLEVEGRVDGLYVTAEQEKDLDEEEDADLIDSEDRIDIAPAIIASLVFDVPFVLLCDEGCKGLCPRCGVNLNEDTCDCGEDDAPSGPFAALAALNLGTADEHHDDGRIEHEEDDPKNLDQSSATDLGSDGSRNAGL